MKARVKKLFAISPFKIGLLITLGIILLYFFDFSILKFMELKALDLRMISRAERKPSGVTVIAAIDEKSIAELGRWPWPRSTVAALVDTLNKSGARAIGFDVVFSDPENQAWLRSIDEMTKEIGRYGAADANFTAFLQDQRKKADTDTALARAVRESTKVTLGYFFLTTKREIAHLDQSLIAQGIAGIRESKYPVVQFRSTPDSSALIEAYAAVSNIESIAKAAQNAGYLNAFPDSDGVLRCSPLAIKLGSDLYPSLSISVLMQYLDWPMLAITLGETGVEGIKLGDYDIPTDVTGRMLVNYLGPGKTFPHCSASDLLNGRIDGAVLKDKIVLVGATAKGIHDFRVTPYGADFPGVELHANVIENILQGDFIRHPAWAGLLDMAAILIFGLAISLVLPSTRALPGFLVSAAVLLFYIALNIFLFAKYSIWLSVVYPVLAILAVYLGVTAYKYVTEEREKKKIRSASACK